MNRQDPAQPEDPSTDRPRRKPATDRRAEEGGWADEAAQARTADDPRTVTPHDAEGIPSTGDRF
ncbi:hypothetical protein [Plantactinospora sp. KBS50]|uniref:hypothetical protein n=1 Tax=Plantactinospora sp. KBS50 TaxID=2024580 RepID=UPI000BAAADD0|nr:hypothetical protein [Plantactinospora sp. KBS50]ASW53350.1 hypothetical protein CIK06_02840 [Plantactinospora sp. KBS50]